MAIDDKDIIDIDTAVVGSDSSSESVSVAISDENRHLLESGDSIAVVSTRNGQQVFAIVLAGISVLAVLPVPYLTLRSVSYLVTKDSDLSFEEMMQSDSVVFWLFGPVTALLAMLAITPFNMYNNYKAGLAMQCSRESFKCSDIKSVLVGGLLILSGSVNGYNMNVGYKDIIPSESLMRYMGQYLLVGIGFLFAGISESRNVLSYVSSEVPRDFRYLRRGVKKAASYFNRLQAPSDPLFVDSRETMLLEIREALDDISYIARLGLSHQQVNSFTDIILQGLNVNDDENVDRYLSILGHDLPTQRMLGSELFGSLISGTFAYLGNQNSLEYAYRGVTGFLEWCSVSNDHWSVPVLGGLGSWVTFGGGTLMSFYLIRDLFFRELFRTKSFDNWAEIFKRIILPLIPAFSFGLLNVILTILNPTLGSVEKALVATSAVIGATVVSRYGIDGGIQEIYGLSDERRQLSNMHNDIMRDFEGLPDDELVIIRDKIQHIREQLAEYKEIETHQSE